MIILNKYPEEDSADESPPLVASIELRSDDNSVTLYSVYSYIDLSQSDRYAFPSSKAFPGFSGKTPAGLAHFRGLELEQLRVGFRLVSICIEAFSCLLADSLGAKGP